MGRPAEFKERKGISGYLELNEFNDLEEIRWREHKDFSDILRLAVQEYIRNHKEGNDAFKLDDWQEDPNFKAIPTLFGPNEKWKLCFENSTFEERTNLMIRLKQLRNLLVLVDSNTDPNHNWSMDLPKYNAIPLLKGDK